MTDTLHFLIFRYSLIIIELFGFNLFFLLRTPKKKLWGLKLVATLVLTIGLFVVLCIPLNEYYKSISWNRTIVSWVAASLELLILLMMSVGLYSCFDIPFYTFASNLSLGYASRQIIFCIYSLLLNFINPSLLLIRIEQQNWLNFLIYFLIYGFFVSLAIIIDRKRKNKTIPELELPIFIILLIVIVANTFLTSFAEIISDEHLLEYSFVLISNIITLSLIIVLNYYTRRQIQLKLNNELVHSLLERQNDQYKFAKANAELMYVKAHDLKHQVAILRKGGPEAEKILNELESTTYNYESVILTDNAVMNVLLSEKWQYCIRHNIKLSCAVDPSAFKKVDNVQLYTLLANVLDNAIDAVMKIQDKAKRIISLNINHKQGVSILQSYNYFNGIINNENGELLTNKKEGGLHGFGMKSIRNIVDQYNGELSYTTDDDIFSINIIIPDE